MADSIRHYRHEEVTTTIDPDRCIGCGRCLQVCYLETLSLDNGKAVVRGVESLQCDHCAAVCPQEAIRVAAADPPLSGFRSFSVNTAWLPHGAFDVGKLVHLMGSRRSCRNFQDRPVDRDLLEDLVHIGITAPSGSNCQPWTFLILPNRKAVMDLGSQVGDFFRKTNRLAEKRWLRTGLRCLGKPELELYYQRHYPTVKKAITEWDNGGKDLLFHGAAAVILVAAADNASCPAEDALLAAGNILLGAHAMGLGTCLIGFAIEAMRRDPSMVRSLGIPDTETPYAVIAVGWPDEGYQRVTGRKPVLIRYPKNL